MAAVAAANDDVSGTVAQLGAFGWSAGDQGSQPTSEAAFARFLCHESVEPFLAQCVERKLADRNPTIVVLHQ